MQLVDLLGERGDRSFDDPTSGTIAPIGSVFTGGAGTPSLASHSASCSLEAT